MFTFVLLCGAASLAVEGEAAAEMIDLPVLATLGASFFGLVAMGTLCGSVFDDPLDGVACALALSLSAAFGVFAVGPLVTNVPPPLLSAVLAMTPLAATASAAGIDLFRSGPLYQLSPLAFTPVAYTHFRAHETLLVVSCRLLLENNTSADTSLVCALAQPTQA